MYENMIGIIVQLGDILEKGIGDMGKAGIGTCQIACWEDVLYTGRNADAIKKLIDGGLFVSCIWAGWPGPCKWDLVDGPSTLGLVPRDHRSMRIASLKKGIEFAYALGVRDVATHVGFIPEDPACELYAETVDAVREVAGHCRDRDIYFNFETGQETPVTLVRTIEDVGMDNLGINLDPANLLMYGKANPTDAVDIYKGKVRGVHIKDGLYPVNGRELGKEMPLGDGLVDFPLLIWKLKKYGYDRSYTIEREISGRQQFNDVLRAKTMLEDILRMYEDGEQTL